MGEEVYEDDPRFRVGRNKYGLGRFFCIIVMISRNYRQTTVLMTDFNISPQDTGQL
jgi:hypothetical protein